jgi:hypothetical protein
MMNAGQSFVEAITPKAAQEVSPKATVAESSHDSSQIRSVLEKRHVVANEQVENAKKEVERLKKEIALHDQAKNIFAVEVIKMLRADVGLLKSNEKTIDSAINRIVTLLNDENNKNDSFSEMRQKVIGSLSEKPLLRKSLMDKVVKNTDKILSQSNLEQSVNSYNDRACSEIEKLMKELTIRQNGFSKNTDKDAADIMLIEMRNEVNRIKGEACVDMSPKTMEDARGTLKLHRGWAPVHFGTTDTTKIMDRYDVLVNASRLPEIKEIKEINRNIHVQEPTKKEPRVR